MKKKKAKKNKHKQIKSRDLIKDLVVVDWLTVIRQQNKRKDSKTEDKKKIIIQEKKMVFGVLMYTEMITNNN